MGNGQVVRLWQIGLGAGIFLAFAAKGLGFLSTMLQASALGASDFGKYGAVLTTLSLFGIAAHASLGAAASTLVAYEKARSQNEAAQITGAIFALLVVCSIVALAVVLCLAPIIATYVYHSPELTEYLQLGSSVLIVLAVQSVVDGLLAANGLFNTRNRLPFIQAATFLILVLFVTSRAGVVGAIVAFFVSNLFATLYGIIRLSRHAKAEGKFVSLPKRGSFLRVIAFLIPLVLNNVIILGASWWITVWIARGQAGFPDLGGFTIAVQLRLMILTIPFLLHSTYGPLLSHAHGAQSDYLRSQLSDCARSTLASVVVVAGAVIVGSPIFLKIVGHQFASAGPTIAAGSVAAVLMASSNLIGTALVANRLQNKTVLPVAASALIIFVTMPFLAVHFGGFGAMLGVIVSQIAQLAFLSPGYLALKIRVPLFRSSIGSTAAIAALGLLIASGNTFAELSAIVLFVGILIVCIANMPVSVIQRLRILTKLRPLLTKARF